MDGPGGQEETSHRKSLPIMSIIDVIERRLQAGPPERIARRRDKPTIAYDTLLRHIDDVVAEVDAPFHDADADLSAYVRV